MQCLTYIIDTFTSRPFRGNPTGVCYVDNKMGQQAMASMANELNFPVSAFISKRNSSNEYDIRYFTPITEIPACGHATLASAKVALLEDALHKAVFHTANNIALSTVAEGELIMMTYPKYELEQYHVEREILNSLQLSSYKTAGYSSQLETLFIEMESPDELRSIQPDYARLVKSNDEIKEVVITSVSDRQEYDFLLRSFCPWIGIDEDPVTGSVHSVLAGFWKERLNKDVLKAYQASARGGDVLVKAHYNRVEIGGEAVVILRGEASIWK